MRDILYDFPINAPVATVYQAISTPAGLDQWWTKTSRGEPRLGAVYELGFGPGYDWQASITQCQAGSRFELTLTRADADWTRTRVGFELSATGTGTQLQFYHRDWPTANEHYRISCFCWAMYLRVLRRHLEHGESVPYETRLEV